MANFISRNILICVVPAVIALLSVYWFRKKKKIKPDIFPAIHKESFVELKDGLHSHKSILNSPIECSSDFANTLSDASSIASPENSSQSYVSSTEDVSDSVEESDMISNCVDHISSTCNSSLDKVNLLSVSAVNVSSSVTNKNFENVDNSLISEVEFSFPNSQNAIEFDKNAKQSTVSEKLNFSNDLIEDIRVVNQICKKRESSFECSNHISHSHEDSFQETIDNTSESKNLCLNTKQSVEDTKDISFQSSNSGECISFANGEPEFSALTEMDSNDSHSSVLDENSLSCISDESESRQVIDFKNKDSPSSVLNENSFCDESERTDIDGYGITLHSKVNETEDASKNVLPKLEESSDNCLNVVLLNETNNVKQSRNLIHSDVKVEGVALDNLNASANENIKSVSATEEVNEMNSVKLSNTSDSDILQSNSIGSVCTVNLNLDFPSSDENKLLSSSDMPKDDMNAIESGKSYENVIHLCDNSEFVCVDSSNENSDLDTASSISKETVTNDSTVTSDRDLDNLNIALVKEHKNVDSGICSSADESLSSKDAEIAEMNISSYLNSIRVSSDVRTKVSIPETNQSKTEDYQHIVNQNNVDSDLMDLKVPADSSSHFVYEFDLPQELCGRLIGKQGKHVKSIKERTNANVFIKRHPYDSQLKTVVVEGNRSDVKDALGIIRKKYPILQFPTVTLEQTNLLSSHGMSLPDSLQLHLPDGVSCDVILSSLVSAGHFFLQQPTHPTYPSLSTLDQCMMTCYSQMDTPQLPHPVEAGVICAAPVLRGWYRAQVIYVFENGTECEIKFVDYGGFSQVPTSSLRQIRSDFMTLPFQATECYLANVKPIDRTGWSSEATATFEELAQGQILQAYLTDIAEDGIPCVHLYKVQGISNMFINRELVERGFAVWVDNGHWDPH